MTTRPAAEECTETGLFRTLKSFPATVHALLFFTLVIRFSYFMAWPFIAVIMTQNYHMSPIAIGVAMTSSALFSVVLGMYGGQISDRLGRRVILLLGCGFSALGYSLLAQAAGMGLFIIGLMIIGVSFAWVDPPLRALMSDLLVDRRRRAIALQMRYYLINVAAVFGPLVGIAFGLTSQKGTFLITGLTYIPFFVFVLLFIPAGKLVKEQDGDGVTVKLHQVIGIIARDNIYIAGLLCSILCSVVFIHYEAILPQYLLLLNGDAAIQLITLILVTNACTVLVFQTFIMRFLATVSLPKRILLGGFIFALSQICFFITRSTEIWLWLTVTSVFSVGEAILMPNLNILLDQLAPPEHRGAYLGASMLSTLGIAAGPLIGGIMLAMTGAGVFICTALLSLLLCAIIYAYRNRMLARLKDA
ncbi:MULTISPECIES: MFS transporter [unclassified Pantoea]|uniref:MFS transporter n=1 Tax=unclassified Pantoea TaxID=2630326 RepID=UPI0023DB3BBC|nr:MULTISPECIES: MFS transporter [unclassified Pantoea]MDF2043783.1 MFS transporter [Pantoea sp. Cr_R14]MDF2069782.1 MFS transporter [Pantoea sp. Cr_R13]MDF2081385.1 MFS transporter [Pantoea sp. Cr_R21]